LLQKQMCIPNWATSNDKLFFNFLAGYADAEGCLSISHDKRYRCFRFIFKIGSTDQLILSQITSRLNSLGYNTHLYLVRRAKIDANPTKKEFYTLFLYTRKDVTRLARILLPLSQHEEKIRKMQLMIKHEHARYWEDIKVEVLALLQQIKQDVINCRNMAETEWKQKRLPK
jgi:hypothetical protein